MNDDMRGKYNVVIQRTSDTWARIIGEPRVLNAEDTLTCPQCTKRKLTSMEADVENELLIGKKGIGIYLRCDGCGYHSEIGVRSI